MRAMPRREKCINMKFHDLIMPSRILYSTNVERFYHSQSTGMNRQNANRAY